MIIQAEVKGVIKFLIVFILIINNCVAQSDSIIVVSGNLEMFYNSEEDSLAQNILNDDKKNELKEIIDLYLSVNEPYDEGRMKWYTYSVDFKRNGRVKSISYVDKASYTDTFPEKAFTELLQSFFLNEKEFQLESSSGKRIKSVKLEIGRTNENVFSIATNLW